jgi:hypothetical protein
VRLKPAARFAGPERALKFTYGIPVNALNQGN